LKEINKHKRTLEPKIPSHELTYNLFQEELSPFDIAKKRGVTINTVYSHLQKMYSEGADIDLKQFITSEEIENIKKAQNVLTDTQGLKPYFDYFEEKMPYWKIKMGLYFMEQGIRENS
ncbi:MAG: helix-turn-helix domain-containing protein, partial [Flavobacteriaceae bacterium]